MRIVQEALDELIEHEGQLKHGPPNATGVLRLALDLRDARARVAELELELAELGEITEGVSADVRAIRSRLAAAAPKSDARQAFEKGQPPPRRNPRHNNLRANKT